MLDSPEGRFILEKLRNDLPRHLYYHNIDHTIDVYHRVVEIAELERITAADTKLLMVAALYHDAGYLQQRANHESESCSIVREALVQFNYSAADIDKICAIIMATKIPQKPVSLLEEIICDADLDYLGRDDFFTTGHNLYLEMLAAGLINNAENWDFIQAEFLTQHHYFTGTSINKRGAQKLKNLKALQTKITSST